MFNVFFIYISQNRFFRKKIYNASEKNETSVFFLIFFSKINFWFFLK